MGSEYFLYLAFLLYKSLKFIADFFQGVYAERKKRTKLDLIDTFSVKSYFKTRKTIIIIMISMVFRFSEQSRFMMK